MADKISKNMQNYRPIYILPQFSKLLEKLFASRINWFLSDNEVITNSQYVFMNNISTNLAVFELTEFATSSLDCLGIFIDFKKAFDTVDHTILLKKIELYGLRVISKAFLTSYLSDRKQFVSINQVQSDVLPITCGVQQGSVLGPTLFKLYIDDIVNVSTRLKFILFADDTSVLFSNLDNVFN